MDWTWYLFRFEGRINRAKLWLAGPVLLGLMMVVGAAIVAIQSLLGGPTSFHFGARVFPNLFESGDSQIGCVLIQASCWRRRPA
jgi:uncharacterized membrane protein YhaH (DUF805 family)